MTLGWRELFALADCQGDAIGECDKCRAAGVDLYEIDYNDPAGWLYCRACLRTYAQRKRVAEQGGAIVTDNDYPPVALGRLDDRSRWHWLGTDKPDGWLDWILTLSLVAVACTPFLLIYCPLCWVLRAITRKVGA